MKTLNKFYLPLMAAGLLASCSSESEPVANTGSEGLEGPNKYISVNIMSPAGTRADDDYEIGSDTENAVTNAKFIVLSKWDGNAYQSNYTVKYVVPETATTWTPSGNYPNTVEKIGNPILVIPASVTGAFEKDQKGDVPVSNVPNDIKLLVLLNYNEEIAAGTSEQDLLDKVVSVNNSGTSGTFVMSNSAYNKDGEAVVATVVPTTYLMNSADLAKGNPIDVYVERMVARADVSFKDGYKVDNNKMYWENNSEDERTLTPVIKGLAFYHDPNESYLFKNVSGWKQDWANDANDVNNFRSYWATMPDKGLTFTDFSYTSATATDASTVWDGEAITKYLRENTLYNGNALGSEATKVVVLAELQDKDGKAFEMAHVMGQFTTLDGTAILVANQLNSLGYRVYTGETDGTDGTKIKNYRTIAPTDLVFTNKSVANEYNDDNTVKEYYQVQGGKGNRTYYQLNTLAAGESFAKFTGEYSNGYALLDNLDEAGVSTLNATLKNNYPVDYWKGGKCYYFIDIKHLTFGSDTEPSIGVVRNHLYNIVFDGIYGFGTPVFNPDENIVPTDPEYTEKDKVFLSARINIHKWRIVNSNSGVTLGK